MTGPARYPYPALLDAIAPDRAAAIEASAGTGKTHLIEHLVVDRVLRGTARLEEIVVVTFTERAAAELRRRIRALVANVAAGRPPAGAAPSRVPTAPAWTIDAAARRRLEEAAASVDLAPISTIHAFCNRILIDQAFAGGRLFAETQVESRTAFRLAFADVVRGPLATDPALAPYLEAWLAEGRLAGLEALLYKARLVRCDWVTSFDPERLARAARAFAALGPEAVAATVVRVIKKSNTTKAVNDRFAMLRAALSDFARGEAVHPATVLARIDRLVKEKEVFAFIEDPTRLGGGRADAQAAALLDVVGELAEAAVPLATAVAQRLGPPVEERLAARKRAAGHYDFDDMLAAVAETLRGPRGPALVAALRARYRLAIIDEFQDTDPLQWEIFRAVFDAGMGERPLYVIGDPKQSIYGFRGADAATYTEARDAIGDAVGAPPHRLSTNFRSTPAVIDAENALFEPASLQPFFGAGLDYQPVVPGPAVEPRAPGSPPITLLRIVADDEKKLPMRAVRAALARAIATEIAGLLAGPAPPQAKEIFVLTRTRIESQAVADALTTRGVPHVLYNQEGLYETPEAAEVRDLLRAVLDPHDPEKRLRAWLTPFFGLRLEDLPAAAAGGDQPLVDRLLEWHALAETHDLGRLAARILDDSGVVRRELFRGDSQRRLINITHLFDAVAALGAEAPLGQVVQDLTARIAKLVVPTPEEGNLLRAEGERDAVQIMTLHKAKGLEADVVFLYGGFGPGPSDLVRTYPTARRRTRLAGRPRRAGIVDLLEQERDAENQRLYYVGLTRARARLYLPFSGAGLEEEPKLDSSEREELWRLRGGYRHVNQRLRALAADPATRRLFAVRDVPVSATAPDDPPLAAAAALAAWRPDPADLAPVATDPELGRLRGKRAGTTQTSYSRIKQAHGGYRPPTEMLDEAAARTDADHRDELPGGARAGVFLHDLLEQLPPESVDGAPGAEAWGAGPEVRAIFDRAMRKHGRDRRQLEPAIRLAHAALTAPLPVVGGTLARLARAARVARELEFLFPFPDAAGGPERGFVKGYVDVIFEHEGRTYFGDWKTDRLPAWDAEAIAAHVDANYALQERLYALALCQMLGIEDEPGYEARFGGTLYLFVRGLPGAIRSRRPRWAEIELWRDELPEALDAGGPP